jgi:hypothetical protein
MIPKIDIPIFEITLPISKKTITFRPFLVKEQNMILLPLEDEGNDEFLYKNAKQLIKNCCFSDLNVDDLSMVDIQYFFIHLRARSVSDVIETAIICRNELNSSTCGANIDVKRSILDFKLSTKEYKDIIELTNNIGVKMKYPTFEIMEKWRSGDQNENKLTIYMIKNCIEYLYDQENIYKKADITEQELDEFVSNLTLPQLANFKNFFANLPTIDTSFIVMCHNCGYEHRFYTEGFYDFFV